VTGRKDRSRHCRHTSEERRGKLDWTGETQGEEGSGKESDEEDLVEDAMSRRSRKEGVCAAGKV
jgi:hypothetical protein